MGGLPQVVPSHGRLQRIGSAEGLDESLEVLGGEEVGIDIRKIGGVERVGRETVSSRRDVDGMCLSHICGLF